MVARRRVPCTGVQQGALRDRVLPALALARLAVFKQDASVAAFLGLAMIASVISNRSLVGDQIGDITQWFGSITWCAVALWAGCVSAMWCAGSLGLAIDDSTRAQ